MEISLREVTKDSLRSILGLKVAENQRGFVADNATSIAQAHYSPEAWYRGIYVADQPVGFAMLSLKPLEKEFFLWRFMIAQKEQGKGYGAAALNLIIAEVRTKPEASELLLSVVEAEGGPRAFYEGLGFVSTGRHEDGELIMALEL